MIDVVLGQWNVSYFTLSVSRTLAGYLDMSASSASDICDLKIVKHRDEVVNKPLLRQSSSSGSLLDYGYVQIPVKACTR